MASTIYNFIFQDFKATIPLEFKRDVFTVTQCVKLEVSFIVHVLRIFRKTHTHEFVVFFRGVLQFSL